MNENNGLTASDVALLNRNNDGWGENSIIWLIVIIVLVFNRGGFGGNPGGYQPQYATQDFVQNGFNFNDLQSQNRDILGAISSNAANTNEIVNQAKYDNINTMREIQNDIANDINDIKVMGQQISANSAQCCNNIMQAIGDVKYDAAQNTATVRQEVTNQIQKLTDIIQGNRMAEMQNQINNLEMKNAMAGVVRYPNASTYNAGYGPFCNCGGCNC